LFGFFVITKQVWLILQLHFYKKHMTFSYTNRQGDTYYFKAIQTAKGGTRYYLTKNAHAEDLIEEVPRGFEVLETIDEARVKIRKIIPLLVSKDEIEMVRQAVADLSALNDFIAYGEGNIITVWYSQFNSLAGIEEQVSHEEALEMHGEQMLRWKKYYDAMHFVLVDKKSNLWEVHRRVFTSLIGAYALLEQSNDLDYLGDKYCPHLGRDSFFQLNPLGWEE